MSFELVEVWTKTRPMEAMKYSNYEDLLKMMQWIGNGQSLEIDTAPGNHGYATIEYLTPGPIGTTKAINIKLGDWIVEDGRQFQVYTDEQFRARYDRDQEDSEAAYDGKRISYGSRSIYASPEEAMDVALAIGQYVQEEQSKEYERLYAEGQFWRVSICRHRVKTEDRDGMEVAMIEAERTIEVEIEYTLEAALSVYAEEVIRDRTACWTSARIDEPDGVTIEGEILKEMVMNQHVVKTTPGDNPLQESGE